MKRFQVTVNGTAYDVQVQEVGGAAAVPVTAPAAPVAAPAAAPAPAKAAAPAGGTAVKAPMPGNIWEIKAAAGQKVARGDVLLILEAMKMENEITAPGDGTVAAIHVNKGDAVDTGALLVSLN